VTKSNSCTIVEQPKAN